MRACQASSSSILSFVILCLGQSCSIQLVDLFSSFDLRFRAGRVTLHSSRSLNVGSALSLVYLLSWVEGFLLSSLRTPAGLILHNFVLLINCCCDAYSLPWSTFIGHVYFLHVRASFSRLLRISSVVLSTRYTPSYFSSITPLSYGLV
jgi:hypothetical protein